MKLFVNALKNFLPRRSHAVHATPLFQISIEFNYSIISPQCPCNDLQQPPLNFILPFDPSHTDGGVEGRGNEHNWKYSDVCSWAKQYVKFERMKRMGSRAQTLNTCRLIARVARRRASLMRISSLDSAYEGQPVARQTSGGGLWLLCARRGAITRNCSSCHFPAPGPLPFPPRFCSSPPHPSRSRRLFLFILRSLSLSLSQKILCRRFYCRIPTYPFHGRSQDFV